MEGIICNFHSFLPILNFGEMKRGRKNEDILLKNSLIFAPKLMQPNYWRGDISYGNRQFVTPDSILPTAKLHLCVVRVEKTTECTALFKV